MIEQLPEQTIVIHASPSQIWQMFTNPDRTHALGGEYVSNWQIGASFGFKNLDGVMQTTGTLLELEPEKRLKYTIFDTDTVKNPVPSIYSEITYELHPLPIPDGIHAPHDVVHGVHTILMVREQYTKPLDQETYDAAIEKWSTAVHQIKTAVEQYIDIPETPDQIPVT